MDSTGVPHVLEHTVLCGSRKYPCRDPFFKMLNRSLSTFMNAFTGEAGIGPGPRRGCPHGRACGGPGPARLSRVCWTDAGAGSRRKAAPWWGRRDWAFRGEASGGFLGKVRTVSFREYCCKTGPLQHCVAGGGVWIPMLGQRSVNGLMGVHAVLWEQVRGEHVGAGGHRCRVLSPGARLCPCGGETTLTGAVPAGI